MPLALKLPFDEADGSNIAYDYSGNNHHASVINGSFIKGRLGNCVYFPNSGRAEIIPKILELNQNFTIMCWMMAEFTATGPTATWVLFRFSSGNYIRLELNTNLEAWTHTALTREGSALRAYANSRLIDSEIIPAEYGSITGYCILNNNGFNDAGRCYLDNFEFLAGEVLYDFTGIINNQTMDAPIFYVNGIDFKTFGVTVQKLEGVIDELAMKDPLKFNWEGYHGEMIDLISPMLDVRNIEMECHIRGFGREDFTAQIHNFRAQFRGPNTKRIMIKLIEKPLVYEVYSPDGFKVENDWIDGTMIGVFTLKLREPEPVKRVLKFTTGADPVTATITLTSKKMLSVYWGDGTRTRNVYGVNKTITHTFPANGEYYTVIAGVIEEITSFTTNGIIVWTRL